MKPVLGLFLIYLVINLGIIAFGVVIGFLLHWMLPSVDLGTGILIAVVATGFSIHYFTQLLNRSASFDLPELEADDQLPPVWVSPPSTRSARKRKRRSD